MKPRNYSIHNGRYKLTVDADFGAHIREFSLDGRNCLATDRPEIGSTFWPSPQAAWGWPPPVTLDKAPYHLEQSQDELLELVSGDCPVTGLRLRKRFELSDSGMRVHYGMINVSDKRVSFAPWEVTRLPGGVTFYQSDAQPLPQTTGNYRLGQGAVWHHYQPCEQTQHTKLFGVASSGWVANACDGLLLIKRFAPISIEQAAPGEAEIEIYAHCDLDNPYIEMEQQGVYRGIDPGEEYRWQVEWLLEAVADADARVDSVPLLQQVKSRLAG